MRLLLFLLVLGISVAVEGLAPSSLRTTSAYPAYMTGLLLLGGLLAGELVAPFRLPRITGYLLFGMLVGPSVLGLLEQRLVGSLSVIDRLALAMIAFTAGAELRIDKLARRMKGIFLITLTQSLVVFFAGVLLLATTWTALGNTRSLGTGLIVLLSLVMVAKSPATTVAVIVESKASGTLTDTVLGSTVLKDILVLVAFSLALSFLPAELLGNGQVKHPNLIVSIGSALPLGTIFGLAMAWILKQVRGYLVLVAAGFALLVLQASELLGTDELLLAVVTGFAVGNFSRQGDKFRTALENAGGPLFVVFFCLAGASLMLDRVTLVWPAVLVLVLSRLLASWAGAWIGGKTAGEGPSVTNLAWTGFIGQAGVSLGLAGLIRQSGNEAGVLVADIIVGMVVVNQVIGPVLFRWALERAGEAGATRVG